MKRREKYEVDHLHNLFPGKITNELILKSFDKYLRDNNLEDSTNFILKKKASEGNEF